MKFVIDLDLASVADDAPAEVSRILQYWAGTVPNMDLGEPSDHALYASDYETKLGTLRVIEG